MTQPRIEPFTLSVPQGLLDDLGARLRATRWPRGVVESGGLPMSEMRPLVEHWLHGFDWRQQERKLNQWEHFQTTIAGARMPFIHARCAKPEAPALLLLHGWPGSFVEFLETLPRLAASCHVVVPSLPGYGFSEPAGGAYAPFVEGAKTPEEEAFLRQKAEWGESAGAYGHLQRTRPLTLGYGLGDSPAGLAAWIVEKFREWADPESHLALDALLTNVTLYWATGTIASSMHLYRESVATPLALARGQRVAVPCAVARFPFEMPFPPRAWIERGYDVVRWTEMPRGGHFAAMEAPDLLARDVLEFLGGLESRTSPAPG